MKNAARPWIIAIGASGARGLEDITQLLSKLPLSLQAIVMVVLHRRWNQPTELQAILAKKCALPVVIAAPEGSLDRGTVYIGKPEAHLELTARHFGNLIEDPNRFYGGRTVDLLFKSIAKHASPHVIGVVLSGSLDDGARGLEAIHKAGGMTMVLTPVTHEQGMPENAIAFDGPISSIGSPHYLAEKICDVVQQQA